MMKRFILGISVLVMTAMCAAAALADVKVKSKQTVSGQSFETTTYIKGKRQRSESMGGMVNLTQCDLKRGVQLNGNSQTYMVTPFASTTQTVTRSAQPATDKNGVVQTGGSVTTTITTKDTGERKQMFGYTARHLIITIETVSAPDACNKSNTKMQTDGWYIDAAFALDCDYGTGGYGANYNRSGGCQDKYAVKTVGTAKRGFAVYEKNTMLDENGRESYSMISEIVEFSHATLDPSLFDIPAGYREVNDAAQMYSVPNANRRSDAGSVSPMQSSPANSGLAATATSAAKAAPVAAQPLGPKKAGVIRIGVAAVKTGAVGEGISAADLSTAVRNSLMQFLTVPNVEVVAIEAKLDAAITLEARSKECDFVAFLTASHKKGGGGFGMFKSLAPMIGNVIPAAGASGTGGYIASQAVVTAATVSSQVKNKDEISLDVRLNKAAGAAVFERVLKAKARSNGDDIISQVVEQAAQGIVDSVKTR
jgi:hypothetical protein